MLETKLIILISGKRKCGKDFISERLQSLIGKENCEIVRISEPIKSHYAKENNLDLNELMSNNSYKEAYRLQMIQWSDGVRASDPGYFCNAACEKAVFKSIWIVSDVRRKTDIKWFIQTYGEKVKTIRINALEEVRRSRSWTFAKGVDDVCSECGLDDYALWDLEINNNDSKTLETGIQQILNIVKQVV